MCDWQRVPLIATVTVGAAYLPAGQPRQVSTAVAPSVVENLPAMQSLHVEAPAVVEYLPDGQSVHIDAPAIA
jgi:hypothetical protein